VEQIQQLGQKNGINTQPVQFFGKLRRFKQRSVSRQPAELTPHMPGTIIKDPQFVYRKNEQTSEAVIFCTRPIQFKAYVFFADDDPNGFRLLPEKDTEQIRRIMKRMQLWFAKLQALEN
jgi:hypothetical protein